MWCRASVSFRRFELVAVLEENEILGFCDRLQDRLMLGEREGAATAVIAYRCSPEETKTD